MLPAILIDVLVYAAVIAAVLLLARRVLMVYDEIYIVQRRLSHVLDKLSDVEHEVTRVLTSLAELSGRLRDRGLDEFDYALLKAKVERLAAELRSVKRSVETLGVYIDQLQKDIIALESRLRRMRSGSG